VLSRQGVQVGTLHVVIADNDGFDAVVVDINDRCASRWPTRSRRSTRVASCSASTPGAAPCCPRPRLRLERR
jgi:hypothetical protein